VDPSLITALVIGLASSVHCLAMCGAISGALTLSLPPAVRGRRLPMLGYVLAFSLGRIASYGILGALAGIAGEALGEALAEVSGVDWIRLLAAVTVIALGLFVAGWLPGMSVIERFGAPLWRRLEPFGRRLLPVRTPFQALLYGAVWGWLPCGLVYWALLIAAGAGNATVSAGFMVLFGLGTLPSVAAAGMLTGWVGQLRSAPHTKSVLGLTLIGFGIVGVAYTLGN